MTDQLLDQRVADRSITVEQIAKAMIATSVNPPTESAVYEYPQMVALTR